MPASTPATDTDTDADASAPYISFDDFRAGWRHGRFHIVVDPKRAPRYVAHRIHATWIALAIIGPGIALALSGHALAGALLVALGIALRRAITWQAPKILVQMAAQQAEVYHDATTRGVMEVQRVASDADPRP